MEVEIGVGGVIGVLALLENINNINRKRKISYITNLKTPVDATGVYFIIQIFPLVISPELLIK